MVRDIGSRSDGFMHLLFISSMLPDGEPRSGFDIANRAIADEYRRQGVRLSFAGFRRPGSRLPLAGEIALGELQPENSEAGRARKAAWLARALALGLPVAAAKLAVLEGTALAERLEEAGPVDGFILNSVQMSTAYPFLARIKPSIFVAHNVEHRSAAENAERARSRLVRRLYRREARLVKLSEDILCARSRVIHTLSAEDRDGLGLSDHPACFPLALSTGRSAVADDGRRDHDVGLIGTWSWAPNRIGLDWFLETVVPLLPQGTRIAVAGVFDGPPPEAPANVAFLGRVPDAQGFVRASRVIALATRGGTGIQLKTVETLEEGMPAVATSSALRGIGSIPDNVAVADDATGFAAALADMVMRERAGRIGRRSGLAFALAQRHAMSAAVEAAIASLAAVLDSRPIAIEASVPPALSPQPGERFAVAAGRT